MDTSVSLTWALVVWLLSLAFGAGGALAVSRSELRHIRELVAMIRADLQRQHEEHRDDLRTMHGRIDGLTKRMNNQDAQSISD